MEKLINLKNLFIEELEMLYNVEQQQLKVFPKLAEKAKADELKLAINSHIEETEGQIERIERIFYKLHERIGKEECEAIKGLLGDAAELMQRSADPEVLDAGLVASLQYIEHFEIAGYGVVCSYARALGNDETAKLLYETLEEERNLDKRLTIMAEQTINVRAKSPLSV